MKNTSPNYSSQGLIQTDHYESVIQVWCASQIFLRYFHLTTFFWMFLEGEIFPPPHILTKLVLQGYTSSCKYSYPYLWLLSSTYTFYYQAGVSRTLAIVGRPVIVIKLVHQLSDNNLVATTTIVMYSSYFSNIDIFGAPPIVIKMVYK